MSERRLHFVGVGGAGMSGLALVCAQLGAEVTGSDRADSPYAARLRAAGIEPAIGHAPPTCPRAPRWWSPRPSPATTPSWRPPARPGAPVLHRAALLGEMHALKRSIAVAGTHGKTTTSGMVAHALLACGREPAFLIGGELRSAGTNAAWGEGEWIVVEADESDRSFLELPRDVAVVTNVELDHHSTYALAGRAAGGLRRVRRPPAGVRIAGPGAGRGPAPRDLRHRRGRAARRGVELKPLGSRFTRRGRGGGAAVPGRHNVLNALAALAACREAGVALADAGPALPGFAGTGRRFEAHGATAAGARVFDDYAHHPTEVRATLEAARTLRPAAWWPASSLTSTRARGSSPARFGEALALADLVVVVDVYPARERAEDFPGVSGLLVAEQAADAAAGRPVLWPPDAGRRARRLAAELGEGDALITLGAGDVDSWRELAAGEPHEPARGRPARLPAGPPDHHPHRRPGRLLRPARHRRGSPSCSPGPPRGPAGRSGRLRIEPPGIR